MTISSIGALTVATGHWGLGWYETIVWDARTPLGRDKGSIVSCWPTLEAAESFHFEYTRLLYAAPFGARLREHTRFLKDAAREARSELVSK